MKRTLPHHHPLAVLLVLVLLPLQACLATRHVIRARLRHRKIILGPTSY